MNKRTFALLTAVITFTVGVALARLSLPTLFETPPPPRIMNEIQLSNYRLSGPYEFKDLSIFLIHGPDAPISRLYTPLQDAVDRRVAIVHETGSVNELMIQNVTLNEDIFVQAGDIVKGGKQDRVLSVDLILAAGSDSVPISAFCVEQSRWQARGSESADHFTITEMVATYSLKQAIKDIATQTGVWSEVKSSQDSIAAGVAESVRSDESPTSLPLALESNAVQESVAPYVDSLLSIIHGQNDVIGFAFAINDQIKGADVYSSNLMFEWYWPRLLKAAAVEAIATPEMKRAPSALSLEDVGAFLVNSELGEKTITEINWRTQSVRRESDYGLFFETRDTGHHGAWVHRSYLGRRRD